VGVQTIVRTVTHPQACATGVLPQPETAVAVTGLTLQLNTLLWMVPNALGMATCTHVGNALGAGQEAQAKRAVQVSTGNVTARSMFRPCATYLASVPQANATCSI